MGLFIREYKTRQVIRRYGYLDGKMKKVTEWDYQELIRMGMVKTVFEKPNLMGWSEKLSNGSGATVGYKIITKAQ